MKKLTRGPAPAEPCGKALLERRFEARHRAIGHVLPLADEGVLVIDPDCAGCDGLRFVKLVEFSTRRITLCAKCTVQSATGVKPPESNVVLVVYVKGFGTKRSGVGDVDCRVRLVGVIVKRPFRSVARINPSQGNVALVVDAVGIRRTGTGHVQGRIFLALQEKPVNV